MIEKTILVDIMAKQHINGKTKITFEYSNIFLRHSKKKTSKS